MRASDFLGLTLLLVVLVSLGVGPLMFRYIPSWNNYNAGCCQRINATSSETVCRHGYLEVPCRINHFTYALMNGTAVTPYRLNLTLDSHLPYRPFCEGDPICPCYFDQRNITGTLTFESETGMMLMSVFSTSCLVLTIVVMLMECLSSFWLAK